MTATIVPSQTECHCARVSDISSRYEYGTLNFLGIAAVSRGLKSLSTLGMSRIRDHTRYLSRYLSTRISEMRHSNGAHIAKVYGQREERGPIIAFNLFDPRGTYIGYATVSKKCSLGHFCIRSGSLCERSSSHIRRLKKLFTGNPGAVQETLHIEHEQMCELMKMKKKCGDGMDELNGSPIGVVRASIGYPTTFEDVERFADFLEFEFRDMFRENITTH